MAILNLLSTEERNREGSYISIPMRQFVMFGGLQVGTETEGFFTNFFITINFQEISDFI